MRSCIWPGCEITGDAAHWDLLWFGYLGATQDNTVQGNLCESHFLSAARGTADNYYRFFLRGPNWLR